MTGAPPRLAPASAEVEISEADELLFRQITESKWDPANAQPASTAFGPMSADAGKPSFARESKVTPQASRDWHNQNAKAPSRGVWACSVDEVNAAATGAVDDSDAPPVEGKSPGHCYVDYRHCAGSAKQEKQERARIRSILLARALKRGEIPTDSAVSPVDVDGEAATG